MSGYARLRPLLAAVAAGRPVDAPAPAIGATPGVDGADPDTAAQARDELAWAAATVAAVAGGAPELALRVVRPILDAPLRPSPFETALEEAGARLASDAGDAPLALAFLERRRAYQSRFALGAALLGLGVLLERPAWADALEPADGADVAADAPDRGAHAFPTPVGAPAPSGFVPFAAADPETPAYVVTLRHLRDARTATFAVHRVAWHDLGSDDAGLSDLVLAFENDAGPMLRAVDPERLRLRLFFGDGPAYDEAATSDGTLFDVEVNPPEGRIYVKLRHPAAWQATDLPPTELWRHLRSCVLITEPE